MREVFFHHGLCYLLTSQQEINLGMGMFADEYLETDTLPDHGLLFLLSNKYNTLTMEGVPFPISVVYYDKDMNIIGHEYAYPGMPNTPMPQGTWWMYERAIAQ